MYIPFSFCFALFHFVSEFTLSTLVHFYILHFYSPVLLLLLQTQTTPKKGRDIIPDILDPVLHATGSDFFYFTYVTYSTDK